MTRPPLPVGEPTECGEDDPRMDARPVDQYEVVDVAIVAESTYPSLKGGVSAVIHDIIVGNPDVTFGIVHIAWDAATSKRDLYGMPANVKWVYYVYLSMEEHREDFMLLTPKSMGMRGGELETLAHRLFDALAGIPRGEYEQFWDLYDEGVNPRTRTYSIWPILGSREFMAAAMDRLEGLGLPFTDTFWLLREFFSLAYAILSAEVPRARVYHAHTTGYASVLGSVGARQNGTKFLLTEHNLYIRDTVNTLLDRSLALPLTDRDWRAFDVPPKQRAWMAWWIEMGHLCYPSAEVITYLYPAAITEAADLGSPIEKSTIVPNGMHVEVFDDAYSQRKSAEVAIGAAAPDRCWKLAYIARVVPIKGLIDLISSIELLVKRGVGSFHLDVLGPTDHAPEYYERCREKVHALGLDDHITFKGTVAVRDLLGEIDVLVLPSYNEGQPIVVLEAMTAGIPVVATDVGGMAQLISDSLVTADGESWHACGPLVGPGDIPAMADALERVMDDRAAYAEYARQARGRVKHFFQLDDVLDSYRQLYCELGDLALVGPRDPVHANKAAMESIYADAPVGTDSEGMRPLDPVEAVLAAIDLLYGELRSLRPVDPFDPAETTRLSVEFSELAAEVDESPQESEEPARLIA